MKYFIVFLCLVSIYSSSCEVDSDEQFTVKGRIINYKKPFDNVVLEFYRERIIKSTISYQFIGEVPCEFDGYFLFDYMANRGLNGNMRVVIRNDSAELKSFSNLDFASNWTKSLNLADSARAILRFNCYNHPLKVGDTLYLKVGNFSHKYVGPLANGSKDTITIKNVEGKISWTTDSTEPLKAGFVNYYPQGNPYFDNVNINYINTP